MEHAETADEEIVFCARRKGESNFTRRVVGGGNGAGFQDCPDFFARSNPHRHDARGRSGLFHTRRCVIEVPRARRRAEEFVGARVLASLTRLAVNRQTDTIAANP
jgi:hypothetical protein